jgi:hypothetical protein
MVLWWTLYFGSVFVLIVWNNGESRFRYFWLILNVNPIAISGPNTCHSFLLVKD